MSSSSVVKRSRFRRAGESAFGMLLLVKSVIMALLAVLLLVAGVWTSLETARPAMLPKGYEQGTLRVASCDDDVCRGRLGPAAGGEARPRDGVTVSSSVTDGDGDRIPVAVRPGTNEAVRTGVAGIFYAWVPLAGALLLASLVVAGGLRMRRTAWAMALLGAGVMGGAFALL